MRALVLFLSISITTFLAMPVAATECANAGTAPAVAPDDTGDANSTACGRSAVAGGVATTALGQFASSTGNFSSALGSGATSAGLASSALGSGSDSGGDYSIAIGLDASSIGDYSTALGNATAASGNYSTALGYDATSGGLASTALGPLASSTGYRSTALGAHAFADQTDTLILGSIAGVNGAPVYAKIGIGTSAPVEAVDVERSAAAARFQLTTFTATASEAPQFIQRRARGTRTAPTAVQINDNLGLFSFRGHNGVTMGGSRATITAQAAADFSNSSTPTRLIFSTTPVGQTTPQSVMVITPDGKVQVKGVNLNVPDYVFEDDYKLMPLDELKTFIDENGHLPGIPSADEVNAEGHDLAGSDMAQLRKIEELTLYTLQQEQHLKELQVKADKVDRLEALVNLLMQERDKS